MTEPSHYTYPETDIFSAASRHFASLTAVIEYDTGRKHSYMDLELRGRAVAGFLRELGVGKGSRIAVLTYNSIETIDLLNASWKLGSIYVPINWRLAPREIAYILRDVEPRVIVYDASFTGVVEEALKEAKMEVLRVSINGDSRSSDYLYEEALRSRTSARESLSLEDPLMILYTGGTTGFPKGALISVRQVLFNILSEIMTWRLNRSIRAPIMLPLFHTGGWNLLTLPLLAVGGTIFLRKRFDPAWLVELVEAEKGPFVVFAVPTIYYMVSSHKSFGEARFEEVEWMLSGGAPINKKILERFWEKKVKIAQGYGSTEAGPNNLTMPIWELSLDEIKHRWSSVGKPFAFNEISVLREDGSPAGPRELGELVVCSPLSFSGYWGMPEETSKTLRNSCVYTGDIAYYDEQGFYYIVDRKKDIIKSGGEQVYPRELEEIALTHPLVEDAAVIGVPDEKWGEVPKLLVKVAKGARPTKESLLSVYQGKVARYKVPKYVAVIDEIPRNAAGKILKRILRERHGEPKDEL